MQLSKHYRHCRGAWVTEDKGCCSRIPAHFFGPWAGCLLHPPVVLQVRRPWAREHLSCGAGFGRTLAAPSQ